MIPVTEVNLKAEVIEDRADFPGWYETKPCSERRGSSGRECRKISTHTSKLESKGKFIVAGSLIGVSLGPRGEIWEGI